MGKADNDRNRPTLIEQTKSLQKEFGLADWHVHFLHYLMLPKALRPTKQYIIRKFNISEKEYYYWLRHPGLNEARRRLVKQYFIDDIPDVVMAIKNEAMAGNERAAKLFLEYVDDWQPKMEAPLPVSSVQLPPAEVNIIINNLHQKFYGNNQPREDRPTFIEGEPVV